MKILVCGAGPLGSLFAARLAEGGHDVTLLARGRRLDDLRQHGLVIHDVRTDEWTTVRVPFIDQLEPDDAYDLALVVMRKNQALEFLPVLGANRRIPTILFLMNNAAGPDALGQAVGWERVMIGFPSSAGYRDGYEMHVLTGHEGAEVTVPIGEVDGRETERAREVAAALARMRGFKIEIRDDMDAWLKYHVALLMPSLAAAFYMCASDRTRMANTPDALVLAVRAMREGFRVLRTLGYPPTPRALRLIDWLPEPLMIAILRRRLRDPLMEIALAKHAGVARDEVQQLTDEFLALVQQTSVPTPNIERLYPQLVETAPLMPEGSAEIPQNWRGVLAVASVAAAVIISGLLVSSGKDPPRRLERS